MKWKQNIQYMVKFTNGLLQGKYNGFPQLLSHKSEIQVPYTIRLVATDFTPKDEANCKVKSLQPGGSRSKTHDQGFS